MTAEFRFDPEQPRTPSGRLVGRPRRDDALLTALDTRTWTKALVVAHRLGKSKSATCKALWYAQKRGLVEHRRGYGYRLLPDSVRVEAVTPRGESFFSWLLAYPDQESLLDSVQTVVMAAFNAGWDARAAEGGP